MGIISQNHQAAYPSDQMALAPGGRYMGLQKAMYGYVSLCMVMCYYIIIRNVIAT